jgi:hypothetical protein
VSCLSGHAIAQSLSSAGLIYPYKYLRYSDRGDLAGLDGADPYESDQVGPR